MNNEPGKLATNSTTCKTGALILAAGMSSRMGAFKPLLKIGTHTFVRRVILTLQQAGASPVVLVTGNQAALLERHVSGTGVVCIRNELYASSQMLDSVVVGLRYLNGRCGQVLLTPADIPMFSAETAQKLMNCGKPAAAPSYKGRKGHPLLLSCELIPFIETYRGPGGLAGAIQASSQPVWLIEVDDEGILLDADTPDDYERLLLRER